MLQCSSQKIVQDKKNLMSMYVQSERAQVLGILNSSLKMKEQDQQQQQTASGSDLLREIQSLSEEVRADVCSA